MAGSKVRRAQTKVGRGPLALSSIKIENSDYLKLGASAPVVLNASLAIGERMDLLVEFDSPGGSWMFKCNGEIVRVEDRGGKVGVAVRVIDSVMGTA